MRSIEPLVQESLRVRPLLSRRANEKPQTPISHWALYLLLMGISALACYRRPLADDFDRYVYEAIVRGRNQSLAEVYERVKHESPRAEASTVLDSPDHLAKLEPLYRIRPAYLTLISAIAWAGRSIQHS